MTCFYCGGKGHWMAECPVKDKDVRQHGRCYLCGGGGHLSRDCKNRKNPSFQRRYSSGSSTSATSGKSISEVMEDRSEFPELRARSPKRHSGYHSDKDRKSRSGRGRSGYRSPSPKRSDEDSDIRRRSDKANDKHNRSRSPEDRHGVTRHYQSMKTKTKVRQVECEEDDAYGDRSYRRSGQEPGSCNHEPTSH